MAARALDCTCAQPSRCYSRKFWRLIMNINVCCGVSRGHRSPTALPIANLEGWIRRPLQPVISRVESWLRALHLREIGAQPKLGSESLGICFQLATRTRNKFMLCWRIVPSTREHQTNRPNTARITDGLIDESSSPCTVP